MNENFINTWATNAELGRKHSLREPIARRREREGKTYDTSHPLAQAIIKGWKTGSKKGSPVDCFVISPDFELMGRLRFNDFIHDTWRRKLRWQEGYPIFLKEALEGQQPGLGNITLNSEVSSQDVFDVFRTPVAGYQAYTIFVIDTRAFENGGTLTVDIENGRAEAKGVFLLFDGDSELPMDDWVPQDKKLDRIALGPDETGQLTHRFDRGTFFRLGATAHHSWNEKGSTNAFKARISVEEN